LRKLLQSPFTLHDTLLEAVARETEEARAGRPARIIAKMNSLIEPRIITALYEASCAGVEIDLIIRGICCLRPGIAGVSDNIRVRSIVGRFLEHPRVYFFANDGDDELYCSSADWMERNFFRRIEVAFPIIDAELRAAIVADLQLYLQDDQQAWVLGSEGRFTHVAAASEGPACSAQQELMQRYVAAAGSAGTMP
jgi:polyphosphate kinase